MSMETFNKVNVYMVCQWCKGKDEQQRMEVYGSGVFHSVCWRKFQVEAKGKAYPVYQEVAKRG